MTEIIRVSNFLRLTLFADAAICLACGLLLTAGGPWLAELTGLPAALAFYAGASLFPFALFLLYAATRKSVSKTLLWAIIGLNLLWTIDSLLLLLTGAAAAITTPGAAFVVFQAIGVLGFAALEFFGLRAAEVVVFKDARETV